MGFLLESSECIEVASLPVTTSIMSFIDCSAIFSRMFLLLVGVGHWLVTSWNKD